MGYYDGIFLIMGNAGFIPSTVGFLSRFFVLSELLREGSGSRGEECRHAIAWSSSGLL